MYFPVLVIFCTPLKRVSGRWCCASAGRSSSKPALPSFVATRSELLDLLSKLFPLQLWIGRSDLRLSVPSIPPPAFRRGSIASPRNGGQAQHPYRTGTFWCCFPSLAAPLLSRLAASVAFRPETGWRIGRHRIRQCDFLRNSNVLVESRTYPSFTSPEPVSYRGEKLSLNLSADNWVHLSKIGSHLTLDKSILSRKNLHLIVLFGICNRMKGLAGPADRRSTPPALSRKEDRRSQNRFFTGVAALL